ncbi:hypothetical protein HUT07_17535 [Stenotrophomonas sp. NA06056]|nr:hypothetical protein HUT07_17535 [Stenotrophomonas sp. NA06056]
MTRVPIPKPCYLDQLKRIPRRVPPRWESPNQDRYYEWDAYHGEIEVYDRRGNHLGVIDAMTGDFQKGAVRGRKIDVS